MRITQLGCLFLGLSFFLACGDDADSDDTTSSNTAATDAPSGTVSSCGDCNEEQVCVRIFGDEDMTSCAPIPAACNGMANCFDDVCSAALYALCGEGIVNTGCSDTFPPTVVSCNP